MKDIVGFGGGVSIPLKLPLHANFHKCRLEHCRREQFNGGSGTEEVRFLLGVLPEQTTLSVPWLQGSEDSGHWATLSSSPVQLGVPIASGDLNLRLSTSIAAPQPSSLHTTAATCQVPKADNEKHRGLQSLFTLRKACP